MKNLFSTILLALLLTSTLAFSFNIQSMAAGGTIYIRADGSIDPATAPIQRFGDNYTFTANVYDEIVVEKDNIVIDGVGYTVQGAEVLQIGIDLSYRNNVTLKNVEVINFTLGIYLEYSGNNTLSHNIVSSNHDIGIWLVGSSNNTLTDNIVSDNDNDGIILEDSGNNVLSGNNVSSNDSDGIRIDGAGSTNNVLSGNNVSNNPSGIIVGDSWSGDSSFSILSGNNVSNNNYGIQITEYSNNNTLIGNMVSSNHNEGIRLEGSSNNTLTDNIVSDNNNYGIIILPTVASASGNNTLSGNNVSSNSGVGIVVGNNLYGGSSNNTLTDNIVSSNDEAGIIIRGAASMNNVLSGNTVSSNLLGIDLDYSGNNTLSGNNVHLNIYDGIDLYGSSYNVLSGNNVSSNSYYGIWLGGSPNSGSSNNTLTDNIISLNSVAGIRIGEDWDPYGSDSNVLFRNTFDANAVQTSVINGLGNTWDDGYPSGGNYWSDYAGVDLYTGPYQNETGSDGIGDTPYVINENNQDNYPRASLAPPIPEFSGWILLPFLLLISLFAMALKTKPKKTTKPA